MRLAVVILVVLVCTLLQSIGCAETPPTTPPVLVQRQKQAKDPAEGNAFTEALQEPDPETQVSDLEKFLQQYPNSLLREDALEQLLAARVELGDAIQISDTATRLLQVDAENPRALAVLAYEKRRAVESRQTPEQSAKEAKQYGMRGLHALQGALKPEGMSQEDFETFKSQIALICDGAVGVAALQAKDYPTAQEYLQSAVELHDLSSSSNDATLRDVYPLALAYLEAEPMNPAGLWYMARAASLSNFDPKLVAYGRLQYAKYNGSEKGWDDLVTSAEYSAAAHVDLVAQTATSGPARPKDLAALAQSKDWTPISLEIRHSEVVNQIGDVSASAVIAGRLTTLLCTYDCPTLQPGTYKAEVKEGEIHIFSISSVSEKPRRSTFRLNGTW